MVVCHSAGPCVMRSSGHLRNLSRSRCLRKCQLLHMVMALLVSCMCSPCSAFLGAGGLQVSAAVPAISINSLSAPLSTATVMAPVSTSIPIGEWSLPVFSTCCGSCLKTKNFFFSPSHFVYWDLECSYSPVHKLVSCKRYRLYFSVEDQFAMLCSICLTHH